MEPDQDAESAEAQLAAATRMQVAIDRERLKKLWNGLSRTESVIRRSQVVYHETIELLSRADHWIALRK